jgi:hypothetical protein
MDSEQSSGSFNRNSSYSHVFVDAPHVIQRAWYSRTDLVLYAALAIMGWLCWIVPDKPQESKDFDEAIVVRVGDRLFFQDTKTGDQVPLKNSNIPLAVGSVWAGVSIAGGEIQSRVLVKGARGEICASAANSELYESRIGPGEDPEPNGLFLPVSCSRK